MGLDLEEEEEEEEEEDYEEDYEEEFQLPPALQRQLYASDDEHEEKAAPLGVCVCVCVCVRSFYRLREVG